MKPSRASEPSPVDEHDPIRSRTAEFFFDLDSSRLDFRSAAIEGWCLAAILFVPICLVLGRLLLPSDSIDRAWSIFYALLLAAPFVSFFWGAHVGIATSLFASIPLMLWLLLNYRTELGAIPWAVLASVGAATLAGRTGSNSHILSGQLTDWRYRLADMTERDNVQQSELGKTRQKLEAIEALIASVSRLIQSSSEIGRSLDLAKVAETVAVRVQDLLGRGRVMIYRFDGRHSTLLHAVPSCAGPDESFGDDYNPIVRRRRENILIGDVHLSFQVSPLTPPRRSFRSLMMVPLATGNDIWGVLRIESERSGEFTRDDLSALAMIAVPATLALQNADLFASIEQKAVTDGLTRLYRRHYFDRRLQVELSRSRRGRTPLSLVFFDVDHFKSINDDFGHAQGDVVLREVAAILESVIGAPHTLARYGGEEFVAIMPDSTKVQALAAAQEVRRRVEAHTFNGINRKVTISGGIATYPEDAASTEQLVSQADTALYQSKRTGRNRISSL